MRHLILLIALISACGKEDQRQQKCVLYGEECHDTEAEETEPLVIVGPRGPAGSSGETGEQGPAGDVGPAGMDGASCTVAQLINGAIISCTDGTTALIVNGADGEDAPPSAYTVTELVDPCGDQPGFDEVLFRLYNGTLIAHYSHGSRQFLTVVGPGNYQTTDGHSCNFNVSNSLEVTW